MKHDPEQEYQDARAAYGAARERLSAAKKARPKPAPYRRAFSKREAIWQAYLAGQRDTQVLAKQFHLSVPYMRDLIKDERLSRAFGPPTARDHRMIAILHDVASRFAR